MLALLAALINFGALSAFSFVNLTVIAYFAVRLKQVHSPRDVFFNVVLPLIGVAFTLVLWAHLSADSFNYGLIWFGIGVVVLLCITRFFSKPMTIALGEGH